MTSSPGPISSSPARAGSTRRPRSARPPSAWPAERRPPACAASRSAAGSSRRVRPRWPRSVPRQSRSTSSRSRSTPRSRPAAPRWSPVASASPDRWRTDDHRPGATPREAGRQATGDPSPEAQAAEVSDPIQPGCGVSNGPAPGSSRSSSTAWPPSTACRLGATARPDERADPDDPHPEHRGRERRASPSSRSGGPIRATPRSSRTGRSPAGAAPGCPTDARRTGPRSRPRRWTSWSRRSDPVAWPSRRRPASRRRSVGSARSVATIPSSSSATCRRSRRAIG